MVEIGSQGWLFSVWDRVTWLNMEALRASLRSLVEAITILRNARIQVCVVVIPSKKRLMSQFLPPGMRVAAEVAQRYSLTLAEATGAGAVVPDLDALFRAQLRREPGRPLFFKTDTHWTPVAAELAAVETARAMRARMQLPASRHPGTRLGDLRPMVLAAGDLTQFLPPAQRAGVPPEESMIRQILPAQGPAALVEDDAHDTVVVGSSNMQPRFGFQPVLSNQLARSTGLYWRPNTRGPYAILLEYLGSDMFKQQRPVALVWQFLEQEMVTGPNDQAWTTYAMPAPEFLNRLRRAVA